ncbi:hypothetical protein ACFPOE_07325 [Caenimonas terrae]|uniref:FCD domain-containing protein n=1 Tax=Caenimonas terrae TaxID=696074 RepID=A0ABW0NCR3_9BURK
MTTERSLSPEEVFHNCFYYSVEFLAVIAEGMSHEVGSEDGENAAWQLHQDILDFGHGVVSAAASHLEDQQRAAVELFLAEVKSLPSEALSGTDAMSDPHGLGCGRMQPVCCRH